MEENKDNEDKKLIIKRGVKKMERKMKKNLTKMMK